MSSPCKIPENMIRHGGHDDNSDQINLRAGELSAIYESGSLRRISAGNHEIIRMIYMAVRDPEWITVKPVISNEKMDIQSDSFLIEYTCSYFQGPIRFSASFRIEGSSPGFIDFSFEGMALSDFEKNRIGFCVLHPLKDTAGSDCIIRFTDHDLGITRFPSLISSQQPFKNIKQIQWKHSGISCRLEFYGDTFETEDQRNWTDASFKTYSTPLNIPYPVRMREGEKVSQRVIFRIRPDHERPESEESSSCLITFSGEELPIPKTGVGRSSRMRKLSEQEADVIRKAGFDHYRADIHLFSDCWKEAVLSAKNESANLQLPLELALFVDDNALLRIADFIDVAKTSKVSICTISLFHPDKKTTPVSIADNLVPLLKEAFPGVAIAYGTNANFAQLNRERPESSHNDLVCWSIQPQEHASDNLTLIENLEAQGHTIISARSFVGNKNLWVSPVNIRRRFNANIENFEKLSLNGSFPSQADSRLMSLFGAGWAAISMKYLFQEGLAGATYFETTGERGIIQGDEDSKWPEKFPASAGMIFPVYHVFRFVLSEKSFRILKCSSSDPVKADVLALSEEGKIKLIAVNFTGSKRDIVIDSLNGFFKVKTLNSDTYFDAVKDPLWLDNKDGSLLSEGRLNLGPYSLMFLEGFLKTNI